MLPNFADVSPSTNVNVVEGQPEPPESVTPEVNPSHAALKVIMGSVLALVGCFIKIFDVGVNFTTYHAQFALASMIFITVSLVNGVASLYAYELRNCIPGILSKPTHICFGALTLITASISLAFAVNYVWFVAFLTTEYADAVLVMIGALTTIVIINPFLTMYAKFNGAISS
ncbi:uncharacterized protein LOC114355445 [Ostrinia furnacalis]|uniref:uncharacterized protein LOC114355445 n=1 Tax=Ostrinia furnacalis TaxID=93504 RepID=UPI00103D493C|nr:uncharacterized protein LOC114355445 [Ostrinia furnacalis]